ncbi:MAG: HAD family hydrolase [Eubacteriales bacterium]|nr:HAD family hydrolase [Eubacteriales bacterium]
MVKLVASDIDGTLLLNGTGSIPTKCFELIEKLAENGIRFAAASGRQYTNLRRLFAPVADDIDYICENGNLVICHGEVCCKRTIERGYGARLMRALMTIDGCEVLLSGVNTCYVQPKDPAYAEHMRYFVGNDVTVVPDITDVPEDYLKISAYFKDGVPQERMHELEELSKPLMRPVISGLPWLDFLLEGCDKGSAMTELQKQLGVSKEETMSFGDNENDIELLVQSGVPCAMRSGNPKLHPYAKYLVDDVADFAAEYIF